LSSTWSANHRRTSHAGETGRSTTRSSFRAAHGADEAIELANSSAFGLGGVVCSKDPQRAQDVADRLDTGMVRISSPQGWAADLPFGGTKRSGVGRELGPLGIDEFVNNKLVCTPAG
jgi:succinate-semialdehyde dehydrogenase/glutarate-semialdehyde dehydrogenase